MIIHAQIYLTEFKECTNVQHATNATNLPIFIGFLPFSILIGFLTVSYCREIGSRLSQLKTLIGWKLSEMNRSRFLKLPVLSRERGHFIVSISLCSCRTDCIRI